MECPTANVALLCLFLAQTFTNTLKIKMNSNKENNSTEVLQDLYKFVFSFSFSSFPVRVRVDMLPKKERLETLLALLSQVIRRNSTMQTN